MAHTKTKNKLHQKVLKHCQIALIVVYDEKGNGIYFENSDGIIIDKRVKELTIEEIEKLLGYKIKIKEEIK